jgi:hypothetical protein
MVLMYAVPPHQADRLPSGLLKPVETAPVYGPTNRLALGTCVQVAPPSVDTSRMPPS